MGKMKSATLFKTLNLGEEFEFRRKEDVIEDFEN